MKQITRKLHKILFVLLCMVLFSQAALAASCSVRVILHDQEGTPVSGISVELCQVAVLDGETFVLTDEFSTLDLSAKDLAEQPTVEMVQQAYQYVLANELEGTIQVTGELGWADFTSLEEGIYLIFERGSQAVSFQPYFVTLPTQRDGQTVYHVYSAPKVVSPDSRSILVMKQWEDDDNAAGRRPNHIQVTLYRDGIAIRTVVLNEACKWQHTFNMLPGDGVYTVEEAPVRHYEVSCEDVAEGYILTNTYVPSDEPGKPPVKPDEPEEPDEPQILQEPEIPEEPQNPTLPQTGFQMWPVYLLLGLGSALVIWGLAEICLRREDT